MNHASLFRNNLVLVQDLESQHKICNELEAAVQESLSNAAQLEHEIKELHSKCEIFSKRYVAAKWQWAFKQSIRLQGREQLEEATLQLQEEMQMQQFL